MSTVITYVVSPGWELNLYVSLHSLVLSGTNYDYVKVFAVGGELSFLKEVDVPLEIEEVENKNENYFFENKTYLSSIDRERVIYLDSDTVVLNPINKVYEEKSEDFIGKFSHYYEDERFEAGKWRKILKENGADYSPYFNAGFVIFQNGSQKLIQEDWISILRDNLDKIEEKEFMGRDMSEQIALSTSVSKNNLSKAKMQSQEHIYGWKTPPRDLDISGEEIVYHTGSRGGRYIKYAMSVLRKSGIDYTRPIISNATHPLFLKMMAYDMMYAAKHSVVGLP
jgi:hypothetical protein